MIDFETNQRIASLQERVIRASFRAMKDDGHHKSSEAAISVSMHIPNMFQREEGISWSLEVYSYLLGPNRTHYFLGKTLNEAVSKTEDAVKDWCFSYEMQAMDEMFGDPKGIEAYKDMSESDRAKGDDSPAWDNGFEPF